MFLFPCCSLIVMADFSEAWQGKLFLVFAGAMSAFVLNVCYLEFLRPKLEWKIVLGERLYRIERSFPLGGVQ